MSPRSEDIMDEPPSINPYEVLGVEKNSTADEIKSAYRKQALKHHPGELFLMFCSALELATCDRRSMLRRFLAYCVSINKSTDPQTVDKVPAEQKESANQTFQEIAFAYAILSDDRRRKRYDRTGRTEETLDLEDDDFNWTDFYREQWRDVITEEVIEKLKDEYKGSGEEKRDLLKYYEKYKGNMDKIFESVMHSNPLDDEDRFRETINDAIAAGEVAAYDSYTKESKSSKKRRRNEALKEAQEAREMAREMGLEGKLFGDETNGASQKKKTRKGGDESALAALIMARQKDRSTNFLDRLEAKYTNKPASKGKRGGKKGKKRVSAEMEESEDGGEDVGGEPPEEAFREMAERASKGKREKKGGGGGGGVEEAAAEEAVKGARKSKRARKG
ncbi:MAG: hypothetical protein M1840_003320 [Geoglossum simile]|nr:MAG: hypothetical protein M1840_003320 [Geoglossum simile]